MFQIRANSNVREGRNAIFPFLVGERGGEVSGWTRIYLFVYLQGKNAYISNLSQIERKVRELSHFPILGEGGRGDEAFRWTETYLCICMPYR